jgi:uncharacterized membrane-anchored protein YhcB (DUF1043 family)
MTSQNLHPILMRLKVMWTQVHTSLTLLYLVVSLVGYLATRLLLSQVRAAQEKTFFSLAVVKNFLDSNPDGYCLYFDTEAAVNKPLLESRGIDLNSFCSC